MLDNQVSLDLQHVRLGDALKEIGRQGGFYFSYSGKLLSGDSLVTIKVVRQPVYSVLELLFHGQYEYDEQEGHLIISAARPHLSMLNIDIISDRNWYSISGVVVDEKSAERLMNVSVYAKQQLAATLTDEHGYFKLRFKTDEHRILNITASKIGYKDATLNFLHSVSVAGRAQPGTYQQSAISGKEVERDAFGRFFIAARQRVQSLNIPGFFAMKPFQFSLTPGLSTHGLMSSQVINKFSINIAGGYTAGVDGLEIGGLFNINKGDSRYLQLAGIFNLVGGKVTGWQIAGVNNRALGSVGGVQLSGFINKAYGQVSGLQISGLNNEAHQLKGVQIGLVNVADSSGGASIGLINIIRNGFYKISLSANNLTNTNISLATGTHDLYTTLHLGANEAHDEKLYAAGIGLGHDFILNNRLYLAASADYHFAYTGSFDDRWTQAKLLLNVALGKKISFFAGPTWNSYNTTGSLDGYKTRFRRSEDLSSDYQSNGHHVERWLGWEAGIAFNSVFRPAPKVSLNAENWYLGAAGIAGAGFEGPYGLITGGEVFLERQFHDGLSAILSAGFTYTGLKEHKYTFSYTDDIIPYYIQTYHYRPSKAFPMKAGMKAYIGNRLFFSGQIGVLAGQKSSGYTESITNGNIGQRIDYSSAEVSFLYSASMGVSLHNGIEPGLVYEDCGNSNLRHLALRLAYRLKLGN